MNSFPHSRKEWMKDQLDKMDVHEHSQLLAIIRKYSDQFTKTQTGILVSTDTLNDKCLTEIEKYITFSMDQRKRMDDDLKTRKTYERMIQD